MIDILRPFRTSPKVDTKPQWTVTKGPFGELAHRCTRRSDWADYQVLVGEQISVQKVFYDDSRRRKPIGAASLMLYEDGLYGQFVVGRCGIYVPYFAGPVDFRLIQTDEDDNGHQVTVYENGTHGVQLIHGGITGKEFIHESDWGANIFAIPLTVDGDTADCAHYCAVTTTHDDYEGKTAKRFPEGSSLRTFSIVDERNGRIVTISTMSPLTALLGRENPVEYVSTLLKNKNGEVSRDILEETDLFDPLSIYMIAA